MRKLFLITLSLFSLGLANAQTWNIGCPNPSDVTATLSNDTLYVRGVGDMISDPSPTFYPWHSIRGNITTFIVEQGVTSIGSDVFRAFPISNLKTIVIPESVRKIGCHAFYSSPLTNVTILTDTIVAMGEGAFYGTWLDSQPDGPIYINNVLYSYKGTMPNNYTLDIMDGTISISDNFRNYGALDGLVAVNIPASVKYIGHQAFLNSINLATINASSSIERIGSYAFFGTAWDEAQPDGVVYFNNHLLYYKGIMPDNTEIIVNEGTIGISTNAFQLYIIENQRKLTAIHLPNSLKFIGGGAFSYSDINSIIIPENVEEIGNGFCQWCNNLKTITMLNPIPINAINCSSNIFASKNGFGISGIENDTLYVPCGSLSAYKNAAIWQDFGTIMEACPPIGISNVRPVFSCPGKVTVTYDLNTSQPTDVILYYSHNKRNWLIAETVTGDLTAQSSGTGKTIIWDNRADNVRFGKFYFKIEVPQPICEGVMINDVCWATRNVGTPDTFVDNSEDAGMFYQWNRRTAWVTTGSVSGWNYSTPTGTTWERANDPSPAGWRVPTLEEIQQLLDYDKVSNVRTTENGRNGRRFTDIATGNSIFLPAFGGRAYGDSIVYGAGVDGRYWSNTQSSGANASLLGFDNSSVYWFNYNRAGGFCIRSVAE